MYNIIHICLVYDMNLTLQVECKLRISLLKRKKFVKNKEKRKEKKKHIQSRKKWAACSGFSSSPRWSGELCLLKKRTDKKGN